MDWFENIGEKTFIEKKIMLDKNKPKNWLKTISAFANTKGGVIIFGIDDEDNYIGIENAKEDAEIISGSIKAKIEPIPEFNLSIKTKENKNFIIVNVFEGNESPYYFVDSGNRIAFTRNGNESVIANSMQLTNLILKGMNRTFDSISTSTLKEKTTFNNFKSTYLKRTNIELNENYFISFGLVDKNGYLTYAGALLSDEYLVYQSRIFATKWNGLTKTNGILEALDDKEFEGNILFLLEKGEEFIKSNTKKMWKKTENARIEYPDYPQRAIQESLVNALIHRDYSIIGSEIHIDIYDDCIELYSPGGMVDGSNINDQNPYEISSKRRNPIIADLFSRMNLMERKGSVLEK